MNVSLTPELEKLVSKKVKTGMYQTASEVVREGLRLLEMRDRELAALRADIQVGLDALDRREYEEYDENTLPNLVADVSRRGRARLARLNRATSKSQRP
jgi:antitoxin ParD1/3/4